METVIDLIIEHSTGAYRLLVEIGGNKIPAVQSILTVESERRTFTVYVSKVSKPSADQERKMFRVVGQSLEENF